MKLIMIFLGGGLGSVLRFYISVIFINGHQSGFPWPTFLVNLIGSFLLGLLISFYEKNLPMSRELILFATTGFCGGFTTFSTFSYENFYLIKSGNVTISVIYIAASLIGGIIAAFGGYILVKP